MAALLRSSGDLLADRRFAYAQGAYDEGDHASAADLAAQVLELVPRFAPAHALLGRARLALGERDAAIAALRRAGAIHPEEGLVAALGLAVAIGPGGGLGGGLAPARLGAPAPEEAISPGYVRALFDDYAPRFDKHLVRNLNYRGPELIAAALRRACAFRGAAFRFRRALDLGCGTGLAARALEDRAEMVEG